MNKKLILIVLIIILSIFLTSCKKYDFILEDNNNFPPINPIPKDKLEIILYYPDKEMKYLVPEIRVISRSNDETEKMVIKELLEGTDRKELKNIIPEDLEILSLNIIDDIAYISFSDELLNKTYNEKEEAFVTYSIVNTLASIPEINKVQILIDGKSKDVLYKHYSIREPLEFSSTIVDKGYISPISILNEYYDSLLRQDYNKSMKMVDIEEMEGININTLKTYLTNEFKRATQYDIKDYTVYKYGDKIKMDVETIFIYEKKNKKTSYRKVELISDKNGFLLKDLLY